MAQVYYYSKMTDQNGFFPIPAEHQNSTLSALFRIKLTQIEMMLDRRFLVPGDEIRLLSSPISDFIDRYTELTTARREQGEEIDIIDTLWNTYEHSVDDRVVLVAYMKADPGRKQVSTAQIALLANYAETIERLTDLIIISKDQLTNRANRDLVDKKTYNFQFFLFDEMGYNPTKHILTPRHVGLTPEETRNLLRNPRIRVDQLKGILNEDPIVRYYGFELGQIIRVHRVSMFTTTEVRDWIDYRVVREGSVSPGG